jgi:hypothetical protein
VRRGPDGQAQLLVELQLQLVHPQQLDVLQEQQLVVLHAQLLVLVASFMLPSKSARSTISKVSASRRSRSSPRVFRAMYFLLPVFSVVDRAV